MASMSFLGTTGDVCDLCGWPSDKRLCVLCHLDEKEKEDKLTHDVEIDYMDLDDYEAFSQQAYEDEMDNEEEYRMKNPTKGERREKRRGKAKYGPVRHLEGDFRPKDFTKYGKKER